MGKDLHYSIKPFIEKALSSHNAVKSFIKEDTDDFFVYKIKRNFNLSDVIVVLSDDYNFNHYSYLNKPEVLKNGGFILVARPEASCFERNESADKISIGKIARLLGSLHEKNIWQYEPPKKE